MPTQQSALSTQHSALPPRVRSALVVGLFCLYGLLWPRGTASVDEEYLYRTTVSLARKGSLRFPSFDPTDSPGTLVAGKFGMLPSLAAVPFHWAGMALSAMLPAPLQDEVLRAATYSASALWMALAALLLASTLATLSFSPRVQLGGALLFALATPAVVYARFFHVAAMGTLLISALLYQAARFALRPNAQAALWLGIWLGLLLLVSFNFVFLVPVLLWYVATCALHPPLSLHSPPLTLKPSALGNIALALLPLLGTWALNVAVNRLRHHHWLWGGYGGESFVSPLQFGLYGLLFSAGRGLFFYSPVSALGMLLFPSWWRKHRPLAWLMLAVFLTVLVSYAKWWSWNGGYWGPRYLVPLLPLTILPLAYYLAEWHEKPVAGRTACAALVLCGLAVQVRGLSTDYPTAVGELSPLASSENEQIFVPHLQPLWWQADPQPRFFWARWSHAGVEWPALAGMDGKLAAAALLAAIAILALAYAIAAVGLWHVLPRSLPLAAWGWLAAAFLAVAAWHTWRTTGHGLMRIFEDARSPQPLTAVDFSRPRWLWRAPPAPDSQATRWTGYLRVPQNGDYRLFLRSSGPANLELQQYQGAAIPKAPALDHPGRDPRWSQWTGRLNVGLYGVELRAQPGLDGHAAVSLLWTVHGAGIDRQPIDPRYLYPHRPGPLRLLVDSAMDMAWLGALWIGLLAAGWPKRRPNFAASPNSHRT